MTLQNRVTPLGELIATPARGLVYGNRGCLHDGNGVIRRHHAGTRWIACRLQFRGRHREPLMAPGRYTELFFLDEATAMAAGHRPCAECRRADYDRFIAAVWHPGNPGRADAATIDALLHAERMLPGGGGRRIHRRALDTLPDGAMIVHDEAPHVVLRGHLLRWTPDGYDRRRDRPSGGRVAVITPPSMLAVLRAGWEPLVPFLHPTVLRVRSDDRGGSRRVAGRVLRTPPRHDRTGGT
jgi:hypothetical protein